MREGERWELGERELLKRCNKCNSIIFGLGKIRRKNSFLGSWRFRAVIFNGHLSCYN